MATKKTAAARADQAETDDVRRLREEMAVMSRQLAEAAHLAESATAELGALRQHTLAPLPPDETPVYELIQPWFSPDCVYYPAGTQVEDITGTITPNEHMVPLNAAAETRMLDYLSTLPDSGALSTEHIVQAAMEMRPREGDDPRLVAEYHGRVLQRAMEIRFEREGKLAPRPGERPAPRMPLRLPTRPGTVPVMGHTRIRNVEPDERLSDAYRGRFAPGAPLARPAAATRQRSAPVSAAQREAPVYGGPSSSNIGSVGPGVQAR